MTPARFPDGLERRAALELRVAGRRLVGYAAVFNSPARIGGFQETVLPGAFRRTLAANPDILALVDHDPGRLLARTSSGTLTLKEDSRGLAFDLAVPDTQLGHDILTLAERRDLGGASVGFRVPAGGESWPATDRRELRAIDLVEISVIHAFPAVHATSVAARHQQPAAVLEARRRRQFLETL